VDLLIVARHLYEHPIAEGFDDLGFQLDFLFLFGDDDLLSMYAARRGARHRERRQALPHAR